MSSPPPFPPSTSLRDSRQTTRPRVNIPSDFEILRAKTLFERIHVAFQLNAHLHRIRRSCTLQHAVLCVGILSIGVYVFEAALFSTFIIYSAPDSATNLQERWALSVSVVQVVQGAIGAVLSGLLLRGALREERRFVLTWLICAGLGISFLFKACVIETVAIVTRNTDEEDNVEELTTLAIKCAMLFVGTVFVVIVHAFYVRLRQEQDPPPYDAIV